MSSNILAVAIGDIGKFLQTAAAGPDAPTSVKTALASLTTAVQDIEAAIPDLAEALAVDGINAALAKVGLSALEPEVDALAKPAIAAVENLIASKLGLALPGAAATAAPSNAGTQAAAVSELASGEG